MELCQYHSEVALLGLDKEGIGSLIVSKNEAELRWELSLEDNGFYPETFDPVLAVWRYVLDKSSSRMMYYGSGVSMDLGGCPICIFDAPQWINEAVLCAKEYTVRNRLVQQ